MKSENGALELQAKGCYGLPGAAGSLEEARKDFPKSQLFDFKLLVSRTVREYISLFQVSQPVANLITDCN